MGMMKRVFEMQQEYPLLVRAMRWVAILSETEASACLYDYLGGRTHSCEAVNHFGKGTVNPNLTVIQAAIHSRVIPRKLYRDR